MCNTLFKDDKELIQKIALEVSLIGGRMMYVGGYVRDKILGIDNKDIDVEVYNITSRQLKDILSRYGKVDEVGASFGILMIRGVDIDFAMPRTEKKTGDGHKGFNVSVDPFMSFEKASVRRDLTINQIYEDVLTGEIIDCYNGREDLKNKIIRHIDDATFIEDPLRVLRACQFSARFNFAIAPETINLCIGMDISELPKERIFGELTKALLKANKPSIAFEAMRDMNVLEKIFPELFALIGCPEPLQHHPEKFCFTHTMLVIDQLAKLKNESSNPIALMLSGLCHDLGKPIVVTCENGKVSSLGHDKAGVKVAENFLNRITNDKSIRVFVLNMVENHMRPNMIAINSSDKAIRRLMVDTDIHEILLLSEADYIGRAIPGVEKEYIVVKEWYKQKIEELSTVKGKIEPLITGKELISRGFMPGVEMGNLLKKAFDMQIEGSSKEEILGIILGIILV